jgi:hypothetical protein
MTSPCRASRRVHHNFMCHIVIYSIYWDSPGVNSGQTLSIRHQDLPLDCTGIHWIEPIAIFPYDHEALQRHTCVHPTDIHSIGPIAAFPNDHDLLHLHMSLHSMDNPRNEPTATFQSVQTERGRNRCSSQGQPLACNHFSTSICPFSAAHVQACSFQGQPFDRAHSSTSKCPPPAALAQVP